MKLLLSSDLHGRESACVSLVAMARDVDWVLIAGDLCNMRHGLERCIDMLRAIDRPTILVPGNAESDDELRQACASWESSIVLHGNGTEIDGIPIYGIGGGIPVTPFGAWSFDLTEQDARERLEALPHDAVLVSHSPPKGTVDMSSAGQHLGSSSLRQAVEEKQPRLVVCGHIHESAGRQDVIGKTPVVNAGPTGVLWDLAL
jgi:Icc-related predicted phosphoesterase